MRVVLISHAATAAMRAGRFPADWRSASRADASDAGGGEHPGSIANSVPGADPHRRPRDDEPDARALKEVQAARARLLGSWRGPADAIALTSPSPCAAESARALGLDARPDEALAEVDYGRWHGRSLKALADEEPEALAAWCRDPGAAPHGGESFGDVVLRVGTWLDSLAAPAGVIAVTHAAILRAAILHVLNAPLGAFTRIDIVPLTAIELHRSGMQMGDEAKGQARSKGSWVWRTR